MKARSELIPPTKRSGGRVLETTRRFQIASPASHSPALSPTRGSAGAPLGALAAVAATVGVAVVVTGVCAHAATAASAVTPSAHRTSAERVARFRSRLIEVISLSSVKRESDRSRSPRPGTESECGEHLLHPHDLGRLIGADVRGQLEYALLLRGAGRVEQLLHHRHGALVVLDHEAEEQAVELGAARGIELLHLLLGEHARHQHLVLHAVHRHAHRTGLRLRHGLAALAKPPLHAGDLVLLLVGD